MDISHVLHYLDLDETMSETYMATLALGIANATHIATKAKLQRTAVYTNLEKLVKMGLLQKKNSGKAFIYTAVSPERLNFIMRQRMEEVANAVPLLKALFQSGDNFKPVTRFYEGSDGIKEVHMEIVTNNLEKKFRVLQSPSILRSTVDDENFLQKVTATRIQNSIKQYSLRPMKAYQDLNEDPEYLKGEGERWMREIRYLPAEIDPHSIIYIWDEHVAIVSTKGENYALVLTSRDFSQTMKDMFDFLWIGSKKGSDLEG